MGSCKALSNLKLIYSNGIAKFVLSHHATQHTIQISQISFKFSPIYLPQVRFSEGALLGLETQILPRSHPNLPSSKTQPGRDAVFAFYMDPDVSKMMEMTTF